MKKCASIGMNIDLCVEPYNYARPSVSSSDSLPDSVRTCLKSGSFMNQVKSCLSKEPEFLPKIGVKLTEMQRFQLGLSRLLNYSWPLKEVKVVQEIEPSDKEKIGEFFSQYFGYIAELIACSESILKLSAEERFCMYKHFWFNFIQLERIYTTCQVRGHNLNDTLLFLDNNFLVDFTAPSFSVEKMNPEEKRRFA
uniref:NR LBD domain-containing protein n=1 Tax=Panagrolaimus sp. JU765 TaxID=591449 RepID=A0AC34RPK3_9BILA